MLRLYDVGVAGIHRLLRNRDTLDQAHVVICVAGMDGALPGVVGGLTTCPVIAVPTSIGYGASFNGIAPLLTMLNACSPGTVLYIYCSTVTMKILTDVKVLVLST